MGCTGKYATAQNFADFWCIDPLSADEEAQIDVYLDISASDVHVALAAVGACDCTTSSWADDYLKKLNIVEAMVIHNCPCGRTHVSEEMKRTWLEWLNNQFELIRTGKIELCASETGADYPYTGWADQGTTEFARARIIANDVLRNSS